MARRCRFVALMGQRCSRSEHLDDVHDYGGPATIPPIWWEPHETTDFIATMPMLIEHGVVQVEPATKSEESSIAFKYGRLHFAARRLLDAAEALLTYVAPGHQAEWDLWFDARKRVVELTKQ